MEKISKIKAELMWHICDVGTGMLITHYLIIIYI